MQAHGMKTLTVNTAGQVGPTIPSTVRPLQMLQNTANDTKRYKQPQNAINTKTMAKTLQMPEKHY